MLENPPRGPNIPYKPHALPNQAYQQPRMSVSIILEASSLVPFVWVCMSHLNDILDHYLCHESSFWLPFSQPNIPFQSPYTASKFYIIVFCLCIIARSMFENLYSYIVIQIVPTWLILIVALLVWISCKICFCISRCQGYSRVIKVIQLIPSVIIITLWVRGRRDIKHIISRCYVVAMFNMQHNALNLIFCTGPEGLNDTWHFEKVNAV